MTEVALSLLKLRVKEATKLGTPYVFPSPRDVRRPIGSVKKAHSAALNRAEMARRFRLYDLSHTFATRAAASGTDLPTLSSLLGNASILMTMRYVHPAAEQKRAFRSKLSPMA
jgi:integrase